jgi:hypothetical protein
VEVSRHAPKIIEERWMQEIRKGADFARHLAQEGSGFEKVHLGFDGLANLGEAEIDGKNGLRKAVVEFATDAASFFVLALK